MIDPKLVAASGVVLFALGMTGGVLWAYPKAATIKHDAAIRSADDAAKHREEFRKAKAEGIPEMKTCIDASVAGYRKRWIAACAAQSKREIMACKVDAACVRNTFVEATGMCVLRDDSAKFDKTKIDENCTAAHPYDPDCNLPHEGEGAGLNASLDREKSDCRRDFDLRLLGL